MLIIDYPAVYMGLIVWIANIPMFYLNTTDTENTEKIVNFVEKKLKINNQKLSISELSKSCHIYFRLSN